MNGSDSALPARAARRRLVLALLAVFAVLYVPWLSVEPPIVGLESTRILVAREMTRSGDWIVPTQNGIKYLAKPPLGYWIIALGSWPLGGPDVVSARLVSALCLLTLALCVAFFARRELGGRIGLLAGLCTLGTGLCIEKGMRGEIETSFALFTSLAILAVFRSAWSERGAYAWSLLAGASLGAATLVKGPVAALFFLIALVGLAAGSRERRRRVLALGSLAVCTGALIGASWLLALACRGADAADFGRLLSESFRRIHDAGVTNEEPWWYYGPTFLGAFLPASLLLPALLSRSSPAGTQEARQRSLFGLILAWSAGCLVALSFSEGKEARYLLPIFPAWAMLAAWGWYRREPMPWLAGWRRFLERAGFVLGATIPVGALVAGWVLRPSALPWTALAAVLAVAALVLCVRARRGGRTPLLWAALLLEILALRTFWAAVPMANRNEQFPIARMGAEIDARLRPDQPLVQLGEYSSYLQLQIDRPFRVADAPAELPREMEEEPRTPWVLARSRFLARGEEGELVEVASWPFGKFHFRLLRAPGVER